MGGKYKMELEQGLKKIEDKRQDILKDKEIYKAFRPLLWSIFCLLLVVIWLLIKVLSVVPCK